MMTPPDMKSDAIWHQLLAIEPSPRIERLLQRHRQQAMLSETHHITDVAAANDWTEAMIAAYAATTGRSAIHRRAAALASFAETAPIAPPQADDIFLGSQAFFPAISRAARHAELIDLGWARNAGHIVPGYESFLRFGITAMTAILREARSHVTSLEQAETFEAFETALLAFQHYLRRLADLADDTAAPHLRHLGLHAPDSYEQALHLLWAMQLFLHAENPASAISFGRADRYLFPFLLLDQRTGRLDWQQAFDLTAAFFIKCCEGGESQNLTLGGIDEHGTDATNPLSFLMLAVMNRLRLPQPSLCVRLHPTAPASFVAAACELAASGCGQPGYLNDTAVIPALQAVDIPLERARNYAIVGCYEATPHGDCYPNTVGGGAHLVKELVTWLNQVADTPPPTHEALLEGWLTHMQRHFDQLRATAWQPAWNHWRDHAPSPFTSMLVQGCIETAKPLEAGGARSNLFGINMVGLGTVIDSLHVIDQLVYRDQSLSLRQIMDAVLDDFPDESLRLRLAAVGGRYGTDSEETNQLAALLSDRLARLILDQKMAHGVRPYPAFFRFYADIFSRETASPDGRRCNDLLSYGVGANLATTTTPTAVLRSACHVAHALCACGNPLAITLSPADVAGGAGRQRIAALIETYFKDGGFHLHLNVAHAKQLREAMVSPERHGDLMLRISGFSARFIKLNPVLQQALVDRAEQGR